MNTSPVSQNKQIQKTKKNITNSRGFASKPTTNGVVNNNKNIQGGGGIVFPPPLFSVSSSYPFSLPSSYYQPPPLFPIPISNTTPYHHHHHPNYSVSIPPSSISRGLSCPPTSNSYKNTITRPLSIPKKSAKQPNKPKHEHSSMVLNATVPLGGNPTYNLPKDDSNSKVLTATSFEGNGVSISNDLVDGFSGSVFMLAPPPSSLPMPKFSVIKRKVVAKSCNAEAGADVGANNTIRQLLRLR